MYAAARTQDAAADRDDGGDGKWTHAAGRRRRRRHKDVTARAAGCYHQRAAIAGGR